VGDLPDRRAPLGELALALEAGVVQGPHHALDGAPQLLRRRPRPRGQNAQDRHRARQRRAHPLGTRHRWTLRGPHTLPKMYLESSSSKSTGASTSVMRPLGLMRRSEPPGLIRMYFSPISPLVLMDAIESSWSFTLFLIVMCTRA